MKRSCWAMGIAISIVAFWGCGENRNSSSSSGDAESSGAGAAAGGTDGGGGSTEPGAAGGTPGDASGGSGERAGAAGSGDAAGGTDGGDAVAGAAGATYGEGTGGSSAGAAGEGTGGSSGGAAGEGTGGSSSGAGGAAGDEGTGGSGGEDSIDIADLVGELDGRLMQFPCCDGGSSNQCGICGYYLDDTLHRCRGGQSDMLVDHEIGGIVGAVYDVTMHFYGIMEPKNYEERAGREAGEDQAHREGGAPLPWHEVEGGHEYPLTSYNTYEIRVLNEMGQEVAAYYLNSDISEGNYTFLIDYSKTIEVIGGGIVRLRSYDSNCRIIKNCGSSAGAPCADKTRIVDISDAEPFPMDGVPSEGGLDQPGLGESAEYAGQWWLVDVTKVAEREAE